MFRKAKHRIILGDTDHAIASVPEGLRSCSSRSNPQDHQAMTRCPFIPQNHAAPDQSNDVSSFPPGHRKAYGISQIARHAALPAHGSPRSRQAPVQSLRSGRRRPRRLSRFAPYYRQYRAPSCAHRGPTNGSSLPGDWQVSPCRQG